MNQVSLPCWAPRLVPVKLSVQSWVEVLQFPQRRESGFGERDIEPEIPGEMASVRRGEEPRRRNRAVDRLAGDVGARVESDCPGGAVRAEVRRFKATKVTWGPADPLIRPRRRCPLLQLGSGMKSLYKLSGSFNAVGLGRECEFSRVLINRELLSILPSVPEAARPRTLRGTSFHRTDRASPSSGPRTGNRTRSCGAPCRGGRCARPKC